MRFKFESFVLLLVRLLQILILLLRNSALSHRSEVSFAFSILIFLVELLHWDGVISVIVEILILTLIERLEVRLEDFENVEDVGFLLHGPVEIF